MGLLTGVRLSDGEPDPRAQGPRPARLAASLDAPQSPAVFPGIDDPSTWVDLATLVLMEIVLGIDNLVFISVLTARLPEANRAGATRLGVGASVALRIVLLFAIQAIMGLTGELFSAFGRAFSGRDLILVLGGLFLVGKATVEIHHKVEGADEREASEAGSPASVGKILAQIILVDLVFSLDSIITAVGMVPADQIWVMVTAVLASVVVMIAFARPVGTFVNAHPSVKILALSFLVLIGAMLIADGFGHPMPKGYIYFPLAFSLSVEALNLRFNANRAKKAA
jgi:predicted tellurium resistance membrane protein TerC